MWRVDDGPLDRRSSITSYDTTAWLKRFRLLIYVSSVVTMYFSVWLYSVWLGSVEGLWQTTSLLISLRASHAVALISCQHLIMKYCAAFILYYINSYLHGNHSLTQAWEWNASNPNYLSLSDNVLRCIRSTITMTTTNASPETSQIKIIRNYTFLKTREIARHLSILIQLDHQVNSLSLSGRSGWFWNGSCFGGRGVAMDAAATKATDWSVAPLHLFSYKHKQFEEDKLVNRRDFIKWMFSWIHAGAVLMFYQEGGGGGGKT